MKDSTRKALLKAQSALKAVKKIDPMDDLKTIAFSADYALKMAEAGNFERAESYLETTIKMAQDLIKSHGMRDLRDIKKHEDEESSGHPSWSR